MRGSLRKKDINKFLSRLRDESDNARVISLCGQMTSRFGGTRGFMRVWQDCLSRDLEKGGNAAFRHLSAVIRLAQYCEQTRPDPKQMSDVQLETALRALVGELPI